MKFDGKLKNYFLYIYMYFVCIMEFSNHNNYILLLQKCVYPCEYTADWKKFDKTSLPEEENFLSKLNM